RQCVAQRGHGRVLRMAEANLYRSRVTGELQWFSGSFLTARPVPIAICKLMRKSIFHEDWWLDAVSPGRWQEVTCLRGGRAVGYLRCVARRESGMTICEMPQITRFLGPVVTPQSGKTETRLRSTHSIVTELLEQVAGYDHVEMTLDPGFSDLAPFLASGYEVKVHPTFLLDCKREIGDLWAGLRDKTRNVIRRAREH